MSNKDTAFEARASLYARALVLFMDGIEDHDIQGSTGQDEEVCKAIAEARDSARKFLASRE